MSEKGHEFSFIWIDEVYFFSLSLSTLDAAQLLGSAKKWGGNQAAQGSASTDLAPVFSRIPLLELPRSVPSRVRVRIYSMRCVPQFLALPSCRPVTIIGTKSCVKAFERSHSRRHRAVPGRFSDRHRTFSQRRYNLKSDALWQTSNEGGRRHVTRGCSPCQLRDGTGRHCWLAKTVRRGMQYLSENGHDCDNLNKTVNMTHEPQPLVGQS